MADVNGTQSDDRLGEKIGGDLSPDERRRLARCRRVAVLLPLVTAVIEGAVRSTLVFLGLVRPEFRSMLLGMMNLSERLEIACWPLSAVAVGTFILLKHPIVRRRWVRAIGWSVLAAVIYAVAYAVTVMLGYLLVRWVYATWFRVPV